MLEHDCNRSCVFRHARRIPNTCCGPDPTRDGAQVQGGVCLKGLDHLVAAPPDLAGGAQSEAAAANLEG